MFKEKYIKYKAKYLNLTRQHGGMYNGEDGDDGGGGSKAPPPHLEFVL